MDRSKIIEQIRQQSIVVRGQALREAAQKSASNAPPSAHGASGGGGGSGRSTSYPDRVEVNFDMGKGSMIGFLCNTKDMYNDGDTPIYFGDIDGGKGEFNMYLYWNGVNWGLDDDLDAPHRMTGPTTKTSLYGEYVGIGESKGSVATVSEYTGSLEEECTPQPSAKSSTITSAVGWQWDGNPIKIGPDRFRASGTIYGLQLNDSPEDKLYGDFELIVDGEAITKWSISNATPGEMDLGAKSVIVLDVPAATSLSKPAYEMNGTWTSFTGIVIYMG